MSSRWENYRVIVAVMSVVVLSTLVYGKESSIITKLPVRMPGSLAPKDNAYLCTSVKLYKREEYIVHFEPKASQDVAHHMLLFGCYEPGSKRKIWDCGEMKGRECQEKEKILFAWAKNAPGKYLPKGVAFKIGPSSNVNYLVLQVHYKHKAQDGVKDNSGFILHTTLQRQPFLAGIFLLWAGNADIAPETNGVHTDIGCIYDEEAPIYAFAYRTHAHGLGRVISGYRVHGNNWTLLGQKNPQEPQAFYPMSKIVKISKGETLAARCTYDTKGHHLKEHVNIGPSGTDEMCNFYIMYYRSSHEQDIHKDTCSDEEMGGFELDFPPDSITPSKTSKKNKSPKRPSAGALEKNTSDLKEKSFSHSRTSKEEYLLVKHWPKPIREKLGQVSGVALDSSGNVVVFHRGDRTWDSDSFDDQYSFNGHMPISGYTVLTLDQSSGRDIGKWGKNMFFLPHGITVDHNDNIWLTDVAMHQVFKFPSKGSDKPLLTLGEMLVPGSDDKHFCQPTDVAVEKSGIFYVADGYCNSRIMKFSSKGKLLAKWGKSSGSSRGSLNIPHSLALDLINHRLYIADRENGRIQSVDTRTGRFGQPITNQKFGLLYAVDFNSHNNLLYAVNGNSLETSLPVKGFTLRAKDGLLIDTWPTDKHHFSQPHDLVSSSDGNTIFVVEIGPNKVWKLTKSRHSTPPSHSDKASTENQEIKNKPSTEDTDDSFQPDSDTWNTNSKESPVPIKCTYKEETGPCRAAIERWYYNINIHRCMHFIYGGCQGNENNFKSKKECQTKCGKARSSQHENGSSKESGKSSETMLNKLSNNADNDDAKMNNSKVQIKPKPTVHETDDWENAAGEDEGEESNLHVWKKQNNTSTTTTTTAPYRIEKNQSDHDSIQDGMVPALIILSVLAVPIVFLLLISIVLRVRAYRREKRYNSGRLLDKEGLAVDRTIGWWSYLNCCSKRKYGFDKVNLAEFYSDSESDGV